MKLRILTTVLAALLLTAGAAACSPDSSTVSVAVQTTDTAAGPHFSRQLPREATFENRMGTAEVARLAAPLNVAGSESISHYRAGDVAYWAAERSIVIFFTDGATAPRTGLVMVGHVDNDDLSRLSGSVQRRSVRLVSAGTDAG